ncbi:DUF2892 domain-containing protein [Clostridium chromiireducens]|uniref:DUF2892 domain-containing protein n=1 Tax=Clostridium chromiireducens TaxID=225345 RepID=A0A399IRA7_9CLOT|nr:DUF2892 domain-containing protein [Clostridium chromiireducens]RII35520.1 DUF2892 domain-containing protein [Clostridium chromiireducens]
MKNVGHINRIMRFIPGLILLSILFWGEGNLKYLGLIGIIPILSGIFDVCPLCLISGNKSCKIKK